MDVSTVLGHYDKSNITIGVLGGHSALDVCRGAKKLGFRTVAVCQRGREKTYSTYYKVRTDSEGKDKGVVDQVIVVENFADIVKEEVQEELRRLNTIFIHNRYFWVYCNFKEIESRFNVPIYGTREMLKLEERDVLFNQYSLMEKAGIRFPHIFPSAADIDRLVIVKVNEAARGYERAFFFAQSHKDFLVKSQELLQNGTITEEALGSAVIEEYIVGAQVNFNYFYSPLSGELELMGTDMRRQTNIDGLLRLPANEQLELLKHVKPRIVETGHVAITIKESLIEKAFHIGEQFVTAAREFCAPGIIGPFALQGAVTAEEGREELVIFDVSMRIPGSPGTMFTPYSSYLHLDPISYGERIVMEIKEGIKESKLHLLCT